MKQVLIIGINSGIGKALAGRYVEDGAKVLGTYRQVQSSSIDYTDNIDSYQLDITMPQSISDFIEYLQNKNYQWDIVVFSVGTLEPIGDFFDLEFDQWEHSYSTNFFGQLKVMHGIRKLAKQDATVVFFTGGAPSGVLQKFSAYSIAKIGLTKMVEYLDSEDDTIKYSIVGPGWVSTKIHEQTINAGSNAGKNLERTQTFLKEKEKATPLDDIYDCINWISVKSKQVVGGRNFSVVWDAWGNKPGSNEFESKLTHDNNLLKIRRFER